MTPDFAVIGHALAAPARSAILGLLIDGSARPASELAAYTGVTAPTASEHLAVLVGSGLVTVRQRGRHRFYELANASVAAALEELGRLSPAPPASERSYRQSKTASDLARARLCYDHLAGRLGVALADALVAQRWLDADVSRVTKAGVRELASRGVDVAAVRSGRRPLLRACPDWTERRTHVAGALGAALATRFLADGLVRRRASGRGLDVTPAGAAALRDTWSVDRALLDEPGAWGGQKPAWAAVSLRGQ